MFADIQVYLDVSALNGLLIQRREKVSVKSHFQLHSVGGNF